MRSNARMASRQGDVNTAPSYHFGLAGLAWGPLNFQSSTAKNGITEDCKVRYIFSFFGDFLTYYSKDFVPDFVTIKTINSVALEG